MNTVESLKKYKELLDEGIISQEEYEELKGKVLSSLTDGQTEEKPKSDRPDDAKLVNSVKAGLEEKKNDAIEKRNLKKYEAAVKKLDTRTVASYKEAIKTFTELGDYKDSKSYLQNASSSLEAVEKEEAEHNRETTYGEAVKSIATKTTSGYKTAITQLRSLGDYKDAAALAKKSEEELPEIEAEEKKIADAKKKARNKKLTIAGVIAVVAVVAVIAANMIIEASKPDFMEAAGTATAEVHGLKYEYPDSWVLQNSGSTSEKQVYYLEDKGKTVGAMIVSYNGEKDLEGAAAYSFDQSIPGDISSVINNCTGTYLEVEKGTSGFVVDVFYPEDEVKGADALVDSVGASIGEADYTNPRTMESMDVQYAGSTEAGAEIDTGSEDITVTKTYNTGVATGTMTVTDWTVDEKVTLEAGETSKVTVKSGEDEKTIEIECTTITDEQYKEKCKTRAYKELIRNNSDGEYTKISGTVVQVIGPSALGLTNLYRITSGGSKYDDVYLVYVNTNTTLVEGDWVTIYGQTTGNYTYETVLGASMTIPSMSAKIVEMD